MKRIGLLIVFGVLFIFTPFFSILGLVLLLAIFNSDVEHFIAGLYEKLKIIFRSSNGN